MRPPDETQARQSEELREAEEDIEAGRLDDATEHLTEATELGANRAKVRELRHQVGEARKEVTRRARLSFWAALGALVVWYLVMSIGGPASWGFGVWFALAFVVGPVAAGVLVGRMHGPDAEGGMRFRHALWSAGLAAAGYSAIWMMILRSRIQSSGGAGAVFLVGLFVVVAYAAVAGVSSGLGARFAWPRGAGGAR